MTRNQFYDTNWLCSMYKKIGYVNVKYLSKHIQDLVR